MSEYPWLNLGNLALFLSAIAVYCNLPGTVSPKNRWLGILAGIFGIGIAGGLTVSALNFHPENVLFLVFSTLAVLGAIFMVILKNPAHGAISFAMTITSTGGLFLLLAAPLVMAANIIVYAGAIIVTFLFLLMLAQQYGFNSADQRSREPLLASFCGFVMAVGFIHVIQVSFSEHDSAARKVVEKASFEIQSALAESSLETARSKIAGGHESLLANIKNAFGGSGPWVERVETEVQKDGMFSFAKVKEVAEFKAALAQLNVICRDYLSQSVFLKSAAGTFGDLNPELVRKDKTGRPAMPADNAAFVGKSLFMDNLIAVEIVGVLLLIATIGAIVVAKTAPGKEAV